MGSFIYHWCAPNVSVNGSTWQGGQDRKVKHRLFYSGSDTRPTSKNYFFPVLRPRANPVGPRQKVMMTMATLTIAATPPWCQHIKNCTSTPSPSLGESFASKVGTRGSNSQKNHPSTVLREIPTRISPLPPTADVIDRHDDAIE